MHRFVALMTSLVFVASAAAVSPSAAQTPVETPCTGPEYRQFDFWLGNWEVRSPDGKLAGTNRIESILGDCAIRESWHGADGTSGTSLNAYDAREGRWHQFWVGGRGLVLRLSGGIENGKMVLRGTSPSADDPGTQVSHRISWQKNADGRVRQLWESSRHGGESWKVVFDGIYTRVPETPDPSPGD
jgi:hypothetical protein